MTNTLKRTPLHHFHTSLCAKMAPFAGFDMPISYPLGTLKEHIHVREKCGIFDVSHMGQFILEGAQSSELLEFITPTLFENTPAFKSTYTVLLNENGGIVDDCIITKMDCDKFFIVFNASCVEKDTQHVHHYIKQKNLDCTLTALENRALIAIQGPKAEVILAPHVHKSKTPLAALKFMQMTQGEIQGTQAFIFRSGYTGEDGFELSIPAHIAEEFVQTITQSDDVKMIGLAARDSLRLEAGLPLYGHDLNDETSPTEASLGWVISKEHKGYLGHARIQKELSLGVFRKRLGVLLEEKGIAREGSAIYNYRDEKIGTLTSGGFCPSSGQSIGQAYILAEHAKVGENIYVEVRGKKLKAQVHSNRFLQKK